MTKQDQLEQLIKDTNYLSGVIDTPELSDFSNEDELKDYIGERIHEHEVVYYSRALEYLSENDPSLRESMEYADDYGFEVRSLTSETLATLHIQRAMLDELSRIDFSELFEDGE
jgi:hypothetical protein